MISNVCYVTPMRSTLQRLSICYSFPRSRSRAFLRVNILPGTLILVATSNEVIGHAPGIGGIQTPDNLAKATKT